VAFRRLPWEVCYGRLHIHPAEVDDTTRKLARGAENGAPWAGGVDAELVSARSTAAAARGTSSSGRNRRHGGTNISTTRARERKSRCGKRRRRRDKGISNGGSGMLPPHVSINLKSKWNNRCEE
jgi:hypothetical protein